MAAIAATDTALSRDATSEYSIADGGICGLATAEHCTLSLCQPHREL